MINLLKFPAQLSILEYRQRKQTVPSDNPETPKDESKTNGPPAVDSEPTNKDAVTSPSQCETSAADSNTSSPIEGAEGSPTVV